MMSPGRPHPGGSDGAITYLPLPAEAPSVAGTLQNPLLAASEALQPFVQALPLPALRHAPPPSEVLAKLGISIEPATELAREADLVATLGQVAEIRAAAVARGLVEGSATALVVAAVPPSPAAPATRERALGLHAQPRLLSPPAGRGGVPAIHTAVARLDAVSRSRDVQSPGAVRELKRATEELRRAAREMAAAPGRRDGSSNSSSSWWMMAAIEATGAGASPAAAAKSVASSAPASPPQKQEAAPPSPPSVASPAASPAAKAGAAATGHSAAATEAAAASPASLSSPPAAEGAPPASSPSASRPPLLRSPSRRDLVIDDAPDEFGEYEGPRTRIGAATTYRTNRAAMLRRTASMGGSGGGDAGASGGGRVLTRAPSVSKAQHPGSAEKGKAQEAAVTTLALPAPKSDHDEGSPSPARGRSVEPPGSAAALLATAPPASTSASASKPSLPRMNSRSTAGVVYRIDYKLSAGGYKGAGKRIGGGAVLALPDAPAAKSGAKASGTLAPRTPLGPLPVPVPLPAGAALDAATATTPAPAAATSRGRPATGAGNGAGKGGKAGLSSWTVVIPAAPVQSTPATANVQPTPGAAATPSASSRPATAPPAASPPSASSPVPATLTRVLMRSGPPPLLHTVRSALTAELRAAVTASSPSRSPSRAPSVTRA